MSLRARLLLGIVAANLAAFAVLAVAVLLDSGRRTAQQQRQEREYHQVVVDTLAELFGAFLDKIDLSTDSFRESFREIHLLEFWDSEVVRDAYVTDLGILLGEPFVVGQLSYNLTGGPDVEAERVREAHQGLVKRAFAERRMLQQGDVVAVPLYRTKGLEGQRRNEALAAIEQGRLAAERSSEPIRAWTGRVLTGLMARAGAVLRVGPAPVVPVVRELQELERLSGRGRHAVFAEREIWGAAYVRLAPPPRAQPLEPLTLRDVALAMSGATIAGMGFVFLLLHVLVLYPLGRIGAAAERMSAGDFRHPVGRTGRGDEIDQLIDAFNAMQREIGQSREALEQRVATAVERVRATEKRMVLSERLAAMGTLAAGIAHEINNPLGGMINAARTLRRKGELNEGQDRFLSLIEDGLQRVKDVVARVLRFSRRGAPRDDVDLRAIVEDAARFVRHRLAERDAAIEVDVPDGLVVRGESAALGQVLLNLVVNAIDALPERGGRVRVEAAREPGAVRISVRDNGSGMDADQVERAFDHFFTTKDTGTGLGLSIVHQIVSEHGGTVTIESETGTGTSMHVLLPAPPGPS